MKIRYIPVVSYWNERMGPLPSFIHECGKYRFKWMAQLVSLIMIKFHEIKTGSDVGILSCVATAKVSNKEE